MSIVIVIATYNEADNIEKLLSQLSEYQVIIVDDNSPDGTAKLAKKFSNANVLIPQYRLGIAQSYKLGFKEALKYNPEYVIQMDAGLTHRPFDIERLIKRAKKFNYSLVYGSRFMHHFEIKSYRTLISLVAKLMMGFIHVHMSDASCGFRCWKPELLSKIINKEWLSKGFAFQLETAHMAFSIVDKEKISDLEIPYKLTNSSFNFKILLEALWIYSIMLMS